MAEGTCEVVKTNKSGTKWVRRNMVCNAAGGAVMGQQHRALREFSFCFESNKKKKLPTDSKLVGAVVGVAEASCDHTH